MLAHNSEEDNVDCCSHEEYDVYCCFHSRQLAPVDLAYVMGGFYGEARFAVDNTGEQINDRFACRIDLETNTIISVRVETSA